MESQSAGIHSTVINTAPRGVWAKEFLVIDCLPGIVILFGVLILSCLWGGVQPIGFTLTHLMAYSALSVSLWVKPTIKHIALDRVTLISGLTLILVMVTNVILHKVPAVGVDMVLMTLDLMIVVFVMSRLSRRALKPLFLAFCVLGMSLASLHIALIVLMKNDAEIPGFLKHGGYHYGVFAILIAFPAIGGFFSTHRGGLRILGLITAILNLIYLLIDMKSIPLVLAFIGIIIFIVRSKRHSGGGAYVIIIILLTTLGLTGYHLSDWMFHDLSKSVMLDNPLTYHQKPMSAAWRAGISSPLTGIGAGNFRYLSGVFKNPSFSLSIDRAHNSFLEMFAETGLTGLIPLGLLLVAIMTLAFKISPFRRVSRWIHRGFKVALVLMIPAAFWDFGPQIPANLLLITFSIGFLLADAKSPRGTGSSEGKSRRYKAFMPLIAVVILLPSFASGVFFEFGRIAERKGRLKTASTRFEMASRLAPLDDRFSASAGLLQNRIASITGEIETFERALHNIDLSLKRNPNQAQLHYARAYTLNKLKPDDYKEIEESLHRAVLLDPFNPSYSSVYSQSLILQGNTEAGIEEIDRMLKHLSSQDYSRFATDIVAIWPDPNKLVPFLTTRLKDIDPGLFLLIMDAMMHKGYDALAVPMTRIYTEQLPADAVSEEYLAFARLMFHQGEHQTVITLIQRWEPSTYNPKLKVRLLAVKAAAYAAKGMITESLAVYDEALDLVPEEDDLQINRLNVFKRIADDESLIVELNRLLEQFPNSQKIQISVAREFQNLGMTLRALQEFRTANHLSGNRFSKEVSDLETALDLPEIFRDDVFTEREGVYAGPGE
ncbi:hypothetical protein JW823_06295 [bacterium]|nr:hypothetical protein [candidate division CSSED10-310 bacterium]